MPNLKSGFKRMQTSAVSRLRNRSEKTLILSVRRAFLAAVEGKDKDKVMAAFREYGSVLDKAAKKGIIKQNNADRKKSRAAAMLAKV